MSAVGVLTRTKSQKSKLPYLAQSKFASSTTGIVSAASSSSEEISVDSDVSNKPVLLEDYPPNSSPKKDGAKVEEKAPLFSN